MDAVYPFLSTAQGSQQYLWLLEMVQPFGCTDLDMGCFETSPTMHKGKFSYGLDNCVESPVFLERKASFQCMTSFSGSFSVFWVLFVSYKPQWAMPTSFLPAMGGRARGHQGVGDWLSRQVPSKHLECEGNGVLIDTEAKAICLVDGERPIEALTTSTDSGFTPISDSKQHDSFGIHLMVLGACYWHPRSHNWVTT